MYFRVLTFSKSTALILVEIDHPHGWNEDLPKGEAARPVREAQA
jgi:hypothetical protein